MGNICSEAHIIHIGKSLSQNYYKNLGYQTIKNIVDKLYDKLIADKVLGRFFVDVEIQKVKAHALLFICV